MSVDMKVKAIYDSEISNITRSEKNWKDVLKVAGQLYKNDSHEAMEEAENHLQKPKLSKLEEPKRIQSGRYS